MLGRNAQEQDTGEAECSFGDLWPAHRAQVRPGAMLLVTRTTLGLFVLPRDSCMAPLINYSFQYQEDV